MKLPLVLLVIMKVYSQRTVGGLTQPGLPAGCVGSFPDIPSCVANNWYISTPDPCYPLDGVPRPGEQVYIKDEKNFCINLPNPDSIFLKNNFYNNGIKPSVVQAEGFVRAFCTGDYVTPGALRLPAGAILSAHVVKNFTTTGSNYIQIHGRMDCGVLGINCDGSSPGAYDDGGQYDNGGFSSCGKEPYSGVDASASGNSGFKEYVEMAGDGIFCMRVCEAGTMVPGGVCDVTHDTEGKLLSVYEFK
ncbi:UNVERIFIED_CONTAM: hypothetical protein HDU68_009522 [Siphonaria sp. JEL0065]|nr:hypothetical protein HDU68_009522 [Siphonaria sp. JEL0065]